MPILIELLGPVMSALGWAIYFHTDAKNSKEGFSTRNHFWGVVGLVLIVVGQLLQISHLKIVHNFIDKLMGGQTINVGASVQLADSNRNGIDIPFPAEVNQNSNLVPLTDPNQVVLAPVPGNIPGPVDNFTSSQYASANRLLKDIVQVSDKIAVTTTLQKV